MPYRSTRLTWLALAATAACQSPESPEPAADVALEAAATPGTEESLTETWDGLRWKDGIVNYVIDRNGDWPRKNPCKNDGMVMSQDTADAIKAGIAEYEALTPVRFVRYTRDNPPPTDRPYVIYRANPSSSSALVRGMPADGTPNCVYIDKSSKPDENGIRSVLHETGHMLGLSHEQQRWDRQLYVDLDLTCVDNDPDGKLFGEDPDGLLITPYDTRSIMHYQSDNSCSKDIPGCRDATGACVYPVLLKIDPDCPWYDYACRWIYRPKQLSKHDVNGLARMYERALGHDNPGDEFGAAFAVGDFDDDGYTDLAVGAPGNAGGGAVYLWKGTAAHRPETLGRLVAWKVLRPSDASSSQQPFSAGRFGAALAAGDYNGDGAMDLAVGAPAEDSGDVDDGSVFIYASQPVTNSPRRTLQMWHVTSQLWLFQGQGDPGDHFGQALAAGDFNADGIDDLAIGVPRKRVGGVRCGAVMVMDGVSHIAATVLTPASVAGGACVDGARFGAALAAADLAPDASSATDDLVVGSPETATDPVTSGAVYLFAGRKSGDIDGKQILRAGGAGARFGAALSIGNFDGSRTPGGAREPQLAVGAPYRSFVIAADTSGGVSATIPEAGAVYLYRSSGPSAIDYVRVHRVDEESPSEGAHLGGVLATWRPRGSWNDRLVAGLPDASPVPFFSTGRVTQLSFTALTTAGQTATSVAPPAGLPNGARFGAALATGNYQADIALMPGKVELVVGAPGIDDGAGAIHVDNLDATSVPWTTFRQSTANPE